VLRTRRRLLFPGSHPRTCAKYHGLTRLARMEIDNAAIQLGTKGGAMCSTAPNPQHYSECICEHCEKHQTGFFAQRNFLAGDDDAATLPKPIGRCNS
jgi:hypothetical protein